jgi:hypothetical protein
VKLAHPHNSPGGPSERRFTAAAGGIAKQGV